MLFRIEDVNLTIDDKQILNDVNANFKLGQFNAIIGPNGSGKSTLIKLLAKLVKPTSGTIKFQSREIAKIKRADFAKEVSFFFQFHDQPNEITVEQMVAYGRSAHKRLYQNLNSDDHQIINNAITKCDLLSMKNRYLSTLSGGELQRVYLAMSLAQEPNVIVLDEPTNHLDIKYQYQLLNLVKQVLDERNISVICILHDFNQVLKYADNTIILKDGSVYDSGETLTVITEQSVLDVFDVQSIIHRDDNGAHIDFII